MSSELKFRRILLKLSGEGLMGSKEFGLDDETLSRLALEIKSIHDAGAEICLVVGGGNIFRGISGAAGGMERSSADSMGMLATVINALALQSALERAGVPARVQSAIPMPTVCEPYIRRRAVRHLEKGRVVIFAAGTGNPYFTTDTAAALRAVEMGCSALVKATQVDGVYSADPKKVPDAVRYDSLTYHEVLTRDLKVLDAAAIALCRENRVPIVVCAMSEAGGVARVVRGEGRYTVIEEGN